MLGVGRNKLNEKDHIIWQIKFDQSTADVLGHKAGQRHRWLAIPQGSLLPRCLSHNWVKLRAIWWAILEIRVRHDSVLTEYQKLLGTRQIHLVKCFFSRQSHFREVFISNSTQNPSLCGSSILLTSQAEICLFLFSMLLHILSRVKLTEKQICGDSQFLTRGA